MLTQNPRSGLKVNIFFCCIRAALWYDVNMKKLDRHELIIYGAGKTWAAPTLKQMRGKGFNINSRWIDFEQVLASPEDTHAPEIHENHDFLNQIWDQGCKQDCNAADAFVAVATPADGEKHSGSLVELGHVTANGRPAYLLGTCASWEPAGHSDRAWKYQANVHYWPEYCGDWVAGFQAVLNHYNANYLDQFYARRERWVPRSELVSSLIGCNLPDAHTIDYEELRAD